MHRTGQTWLLVGAIIGLGCGAYGMHRQAEVAEASGDWDAAVLHYLELTQQEPNNVTFRSALLRAKIKASQQHFDVGRKFQQAGSLERALFEYRQAVELDPTNQYAFVELTKVREELRAREEDRDSLKTVEEMKREARERSQPPLLNPRSSEPISLDFPQPVPIKDVYRALGKAYGINILFDPNLREQEIAIELKEVTAQDALEILMRAAQHFYKVLDEHTILIAAESAQNRRAYEDQVIQTFFLSNAEVKDVMTMLRTMVDAKKVAANDQLNAIIMRDSADRVKIAERLIDVNDKARAEVVVDVELLQVNSRAIQDIGMTLSNYTVNQSLDLGEGAGGLRLSDLGNLNQNHWALSIPSFIYSFVKNNSDAQVLARPQLRISEGEKASLHIGERVPIPTTTFNQGQANSQGIIPVTSFQYTDIGIKVSIEPRVHHNLEISLTLSVEVSNLSGSVPGTSGVAQPIIGTRNIETTIRLKDGETNFLAGLLRTDEISGEVGLPGISEIPVLGRLFSKRDTDVQRTDVILTMTPHIIRRSDITEDDLLPIWVGTDANPSFRGGSPRVESEVDGPFDEGTSAADRVRELIRQRVEELPRGLQQDVEGGGAEEEKEPEEPAIDLAPPAFEPDQSSLDQARPGPEVGPSPRGGVSIALASSAGPPVQLHLSSVDGSVRLNDRIELVVEAETRVPVSHLPLQLSFDQERLRLVEWRRGEFLGSPAEAQVLAAESDPGRILVGASRIGDRPGVQGRGIVAVFTFEAIGVGRASVSFAEIEALGRELESIGPARGEGLEVTVRPGIVFPNRPLEPTVPVL